MTSTRKAPKGITRPYPEQPKWTPQLRMRLAREEMGLSQAELAQRLELSLKTIGNWENGGTDFDHIRPRWLAEMATELAVTVEWLKTGDESTPRPKAPMAEVFRLPNGSLARHRGEQVIGQATPGYLESFRSLASFWVGHRSSIAA